MTVCFADLAGFTRLGEAIPPEDLERVANRLAELAHDVSSAPVRFVKSIGDAAMLVCSHPAPLINAVLDLADATAAHDLPRLRIGVASGCAVSRAGDWFGSPVNVASRVTAAAQPGAVLVAESTKDAHRQRRWLRVVVDRCEASQGSQRRREALPRATGRDGVNRRSRRLLLTTNTELNAIAAPAITGLSRPRAAIGSAATL